jgi:pyrroloquinoline quinone biosynthesis protein B
MRSSVLKLLFVLFFVSKIHSQNDTLPYILVLGITQDGGYPQAGCTKTCCEMAWKSDSVRKNVVSLAVVFPKQKKWWLFEATPDIGRQLRMFAKLTNSQFQLLPEGVFLTHAHIGHYTGLMQFGREVMNTKELPVYVLPKMKSFLEKNGPWQQLIRIKNISLRDLKVDSVSNIAESFSVKPFKAPHRDEYSETAGFLINAGQRKTLFIPDINNWNSINLLPKLAECDQAFLDGTFYTADELPNREIKEVPHPPVINTMQLLKTQSDEARAKVYFIHFNHTNPLLNNKQTRSSVIKAGFNIAEEGKKYY